MSRRNRRRKPPVPQSDSPILSAVSDSQLAQQGLSRPATSEEMSRSLVARGSNQQSVFTRFRSRLARLPQAIDDLGSEMSLEVIHLMYNDPQISGPVDTTVLGRLGHGIRLVPRYKRGHELYEEGLKAYDEASWMLEFCYDNSEPELEIGLDSVTEEIGRNLVLYGNTASEIELTTQAGPGRGTRANSPVLSRLAGLSVPKALRVRSPECYQYVVDNAGATRWLAVRSADPEADSWWARDRFGLDWRTNLGLNLPPDWVLLPPDKFVVVSSKTRFGDPRGQSALRHAYSAWYLSMLLWPEYHKFLQQCATPGIHAELPPDAVPSRDQSGRVIRPEDEMLEALEDYMGGGVIVTKNGAKVSPFWSQSDGTAFHKAFELLGREKARAIQMSILQSDVAHNNTRAASETHKDVGDLAARALSKRVAMSMFLQYFRRITAINRGKLYARLYTPFCGFGDISPEDQMAQLQALGSVGYTISPSQLHAIDAQIEMPERSEEDVRLLAEQLEKPVAQPQDNSKTSQSKPGKKETK